ncbi:MAG: pentapeptide repeat-containing protein [Actinomycetota bacterium]
MRRLIIIGFLLLGGVVLSACHQNGTVLTVDDGGDEPDANPGDGICASSTGDCTFRAAVMEANAVPGVELIDITVPYVRRTLFGKAEDGGAVGDYDITEAVVIQGAPTLIDAAGGGRIIDLHHTAGLVELLDLGLVRGNEAQGAGIRHNQGDAWLLIEDSYVSRTDVDGNVINIAGGDGGAILRNVSVSSTTGTGAAITNRGATFSATNLTIADNDAGGIVGSASGTTELINATVAGNIFGLTGGPFTVRDSIVADNTTDCSAIFGTPLITSLGHNIESATTCGFTAAGDLQNTDARVLPVLGNPMNLDFPDAPIAATSPARDAAKDCVPVDTLGTARPVGPACDVGAIELTPGPGCADPTIGTVSFCDFAGVDLSGTELNFTRFYGTDFTGANLDGLESMISEFDGVSFESASLRGANLNGSALGNLYAAGADFTGALIRSTSLRDSDFSGVDFTDADLLGAGGATSSDFTGAVWNNTVCPSGVNSDANGGTCIGEL